MADKAEELARESKPLTYEQEVHAMLCAAAANTEDLLRYFEAQASNESGEAKRLTEKCIEWKRDDLRRIRALIPQAALLRPHLESERCGNCDHHSELHNIHGCTVRIQMEDGKTMVDCPCAWDNLQASDKPIPERLWCSYPDCNCEREHGGKCQSDPKPAPPVEEPKCVKSTMQELRKERDAHKEDLDKAILTIRSEGERAERAESALAEARGKALDEAARVVAEMKQPEFGVGGYANWKGIGFAEARKVGVAALLALKEKR